ncbi:hypothetical protein [Plantactinospora sp. KLBMP9567]|uniref:hypothetical protein n=1 Tax=Plantactinospora sp. KLBMP9567 TaxID=3085900 RepID=UPI002981A7B4|nr:hypothetical protein [Plantactinospora sp. KLBMP9567]MDW5327480.1 hypothetical protein [Plantactinospora sp. KLBMP9567]
MYLSLLKARSGLSYADLERRARSVGRHGSRELKRSTVSDLLQGKRALPRPIVESFVAALDLPDTERAQVLATWERIAAHADRRDGAPRFTDVSPRELGIHAAITAPDTVDELPRYVSRCFDHELSALIRRGAEQGCFVLLVGGSSTGKTRSLYEAVRGIVPDWPLARPATTQEILQLLHEPAEQTVVWLDEMHRFLGSTPPLTRTAVSSLKNARMIVVGTLWSEEYTARKELRPVGLPDQHADDRTLLELAEVISVEPTLREQERRTAERVAETDARIRIALHSRDAGLTQVLAAGPDLIHRWEQAPPYARAAITAAADARRLGVHTPLAPELLVDAMAGYLAPAERVTDTARWLDDALSYATKPVHGTVAALSPRPGRRPGTLAGYVAADYLAQRLRQVRRTQCPPDSLWEALIDRLEDTDDVRRVREAAAARMRYPLQERALRRLCALGDDSAHVQLALLLVRQDRLAEAVSVLLHQAQKRPDDDTVTDALRDVLALRGRSAGLRTSDPQDQIRLAELLQDGGETADLRLRAADGDLVAVDDLTYLLADRGFLPDLEDLADAGHRVAADLLAELLATHGRLDELAVRADAGDESAANRLSKLQADDPGSITTGVEAQIETLRSAVVEGRRHGAEQLTTLLFELRNDEVLRAEVDAGTQFAAERLIALKMTDCGRDWRAAVAVLRLRSCGLHADGSPADPGATS